MSRELLDTADHLLSRTGGVTPADACRAISTIYYAAFHFLAGECCKLFLGNPNGAPTRAWDHLYRSLSHTTVDKKCVTSTLQQRGFPPQIIDFAHFLRQMQHKREKCDYGHNIQPKVSSISTDIAFARDHMNKFEAVDERHRKAFAIYVLFKENRAEMKPIDV